MMHDPAASSPADGERRAEGPFRVVVTGGPGGGKTTAADLFRREIGDRVVVVPEAATLLFSGGFPRPEGEELAGRSAQQAIYHVQRNLEEIQAARYPDRLLLCDRGTVDGAAYWPDGADEFFAGVGSTLRRELARYDAVLFFETAAKGGRGFESENRFRTESQDEAVAIDNRLRALWQAHPRFVLIPHAHSFFRKMTMALGILESLLAQIDDPVGPVGPDPDPSRST
jgi:predicted ATPase